MRVFWHQTPIYAVQNVWFEFIKINFEWYQIISKWHFKKIKMKKEKVGGNDMHKFTYTHFTWWSVWQKLKMTFKIFFMDNNFITHISFLHYTYIILSASYCTYITSYNTYNFQHVTNFQNETDFIFKNCILM